MIKDENVSRNIWQLARVLKIHASSDTKIRRVSLHVAFPDSKETGNQKILERPIHKLALLVEGTGAIPDREPTN